MKRLKLTAALLMLGMLTGSPKVSAQQIEPINLGCTEDLRIIFGQKAPDFCRSAEADSRILFDGFEVKEGADRSIQIDMKVFNLGSADALVEVYDARGNLLDLKVIGGSNPPTDLFRSGLDVFIKVPTSFFSRYPIGDPRRNLEEQTVSVTIPAGGYVDITKSSDMAYWYNVIIAGVDLIQLAQDLAQQPAPQPAQGDPNFVQSKKMLKEMVLDFLKAYSKAYKDDLKASGGEQAVVNIFKSEPFAQGVSLAFVNREQLILILADFFKWVRDNPPLNTVYRGGIEGGSVLLDVFIDTTNEGIETALDRALPGLGIFARAVRQSGSALNTAARLADLYNNYFVAEEKAVVTLRNTAAPSSNFNDAVASVNQQLWGTWEVKNEAGESILFIFTPQGQLFILEQQSSQSYIAAPFRYEVNSSYQPMHMDLIDSGGDRGRTIFEFIADGQLRLELANSNPDNRPSNFTLGGVVFTKISNIANLPPNTEVVDLSERANRARQVEARNNLGAMNRAQQAYYLEYAKFATNIQDLNIGIPAETENYRYRITTPGGASRLIAIITASAKRSGLKSYTGVVWVSQRNGENITLARLCETNEPSISAPGIIISPQTNEGLECRCADDARDMYE